MVDLRVEPVLRDIQPTGKLLGTGPYKWGEEVEVAGTLCASARINQVLLEDASFGDTILRHFAAECRMMSNLRHPHIITFLGTSYLHGSLALLTEKLPYKLGRILKSCREIPLCLKCSILSDVARGLAYLHTLSIVHCNISSRYVFLNSGLEAKISGFHSAQ